MAWIIAALSIAAAAPWCVVAVRHVRGRRARADVVRTLGRLGHVIDTDRAAMLDVTVWVSDASAEEVVYDVEDEIRDRHPNLNMYVRHRRGRPPE